MWVLSAIKIYNPSNQSDKISRSNKKNIKKNSQQSSTWNDLSDSLPITCSHTSLTRVPPADELFFLSTISFSFLTDKAQSLLAAKVQKTSSQWFHFNTIVIIKVYRIFGIVIVSIIISFRFHSANTTSNKKVQTL